MAIRTIVKDGDEVLAKKCRTVTEFDSRLALLLDDMIDTLKDADGAGLAAPQVGILKRICLVDAGDGVIELINPEIIETKGSQREIEGCLSCPGVWGYVKRPMRVTVKAQDRNGDEFTVSGEGLKARAFCHEIDHLDGVLFKSKVVEFVNFEEDGDQ